MTCENCKHNSERGWCELRDERTWGCALPNDHDGECQEGWLRACPNHAVEKFMAGA
jgi:hypothetical protein